MDLLPSNPTTHESRRQAKSPSKLGNLSNKPCIPSLSFPMNAPAIEEPTNPIYVCIGSFLFPRLFKETHPSSKTKPIHLNSVMQPAHNETKRRTCTTQQPPIHPSSKFRVEQRTEYYIPLFFSSSVGGYRL